jgi:hypothetical protein
MKKSFLATLLVIIPFILIVFVFLYSCQHDAVKSNELRQVYFDKEVLPIMLNNCTASGCHGAGGDVFALTTYDEIVKQVVKGNPSSSRLYQAITSTTNIMPPGKALTAQQRALIYVWIIQGAENNTDTSAVPVDTNKVTEKYPVCFSRDILPVIISNCTASGCHNESNTELPALTNYDNIKQHVVAGFPQNSHIYEVINSSGEDQMPPLPSSKLPQANIDSIYRWIKLGAKNETCPTICDTTKYSFKNDVFPILSSNCVSCHNSNTANGYTNLEDYNNVKNAASSGELVKVINKTGSFPQMPPSGKMNDCNIKKIEKWVAAGMKND